MVQLTLTNQHPHATRHRAVIDLVNDTCTLDGIALSRMELMLSPDFKHPLIAHPFHPIETTSFHYEYDDLTALLNIAPWIYSTLLQANNPKACQFKMTPSSRFTSNPFEKQLYFSIHHRKKAKSSIQIRQLEAIVRELNECPFTFSEDLKVDTSLTLNDLPSNVDGDSLFINDPALLNLYTTPTPFYRCELRYMDAKIGFGVFCRELIKEGDIIGIYTGHKTQQIEDRQYTFDSQFDALNLCTDARHHGNITRFINHAPSPEEVQTVSSNPAFLTANLVGNHHCIGGLKIVTYMALRDIAEGEQLLVSYGAHFPVDPFGVQFMHPNQIVYTNKTKRPGLRHDIRPLKIMATHGVQAAQWFLIARWISIIVFFVILEQSILLARPT